MRGGTPGAALELLEHRCGLGASERCELLQITFGAGVDLVQLADQVERASGFRVIWLGVLELSEAVRPTACKDDMALRASARFVGLERIANDHAPVLADEQRERRRALVFADAVDDRTGRGEAPHLPRLGAGPVEPRPARLIQADHRLLHHVLAQSGDRDLQSLRDRVELVP